MTTRQRVVGRNPYCAAWLLSKPHSAQWDCALRGLELKIPQTLLISADKVIE